MKSKSGRPATPYMIHYFPGKYWSCGAKLILLNLFNFRIKNLQLPFLKQDLMANLCLKPNVILFNSLTITVTKIIVEKFKDTSGGLKSSETIVTEPILNGNDRWST